MREILFRGKDINSGEWVYGGYHNRTESYGVECDEHYITSEDFHGEVECFMVDKGTVSQYIGQKTTCGTKLFEGDILQANFEKHSEDKFKIMIAFSHKDACYIAHDGEDLKDNWCSHFTLVGNQFDNPELLKDLC